MTRCCATPRWSSAVDKARSAIDKKIRNKIGDLKLVLNNETLDASIDTIVNHIIVMIKERDAKELK